MRVVVALMLFLWGNVSSGQQSQSRVWNFEEDAVGKLPAGWSAAKTGEGEGSVWKVIEDESAPRGARALAQTAAGPRPLFNLCVVDGSNYQDLELIVAFKAVEGKVDQGGGVVWRYADANNYYIARFNPLEDNYRVYKVVDGRRTQLATKEGITAPAGKWHTLAIRMTGDTITCSLNGTEYLTAKDDTFAKAGQIGLWTKADAQTYFDQLEAKKPK